MGVGQIDCVLHAVVMTTWPAEPIGAPTVMQNARQTKRGHNTPVRAATHGRIRGPLRPEDTRGWAQRSTSPERSVDGRTVDACTSWSSGRNVRGKIDTSSARVVEQQWRNPMRPWGGGGCGGDPGSNDDLACSTACFSKEVGGCCCSMSGDVTSAAQRPSGLTIRPQATQQDVRDLLTAMHQIGKAMATVGDKVDMFMHPQPSVQRSGST